MHLKQYMKKHDLSDKEVAKVIGLNRVSITRYRNGVITPSLDVIERIDKFTDGSVTWRDWLSASARRRAGEAAE
jgi:transcriptional regulator with XRE-family HTH domain